MSVRVCPACGSQYVGSVDRCVDCDVELDVAPDEAEAESIGLGEGDDRVTCVLEGWSNESKVTLAGMLTQHAILHVWEAGDLVVRRPDWPEVQRLIEEVEVAEQPVLEPDEDQIVYDLSDLDEGQRADVEAMLMAEEIAHGWDQEGGLVVAESDEDRVSPLLDRVEMADELTADEVESAEDDDTGDDDGADDGLAAQDAMSTLFVIVDKMMKDPTDKGEVKALERTAADIGGLGVPYGFSKAVWSDIQGQARALFEMVTGDDPPLEDARHAARRLREVLHQYV